MRSELKLLHEEHSAVLGHIQVFQDGVERKLLVEGATQSIYRIDGSMRGYWIGMVPELSVQSALILGLGGGTVARALRERFPKINIIAYEVDPQIIKIAKKYFNLDPKITIRIQDARKAFETSEKFDLVIVDMYQGYRFVEFAEEEDFLRQVADKIGSAGRAAFNRVPEGFNRSNLREFEKKMKNIFPEFWIQKADLNLIYWGKN